MSAALTGNDSIQTRVRELDREDNLDLTATDNVRQVNTAMFALASIVKDFSLRRQVTLTTTVNTETITWTATIFFDVVLIEIQDPLDELRYKRLVPSPSEIVWQMAGKEPNGFPRLYLMQHDGSNMQIALRPIPDTGSLNVRVTGYIQPTKFTTASTTPWQSERLDDALAYMIAATRQRNKADPFYASQLAAEAQRLIELEINRELTPTERSSLGIMGNAA